MDVRWRWRRGRGSVPRVSHPEGEQIVDVTIEAVRDRFHTLNVPMAVPSTAKPARRVPDSVLEAVSRLSPHRERQRTAGSSWKKSMVTDDVIGSARAAASNLLGVASSTKSPSAPT